MRRRGVSSRRAAELRFEGGHFQRTTRSDLRNESWRGQCQPTTHIATRTLRHEVFPCARRALPARALAVRLAEALCSPEPLCSPSGWLALAEPSSTRHSRAAASSRPTCRQPALRRRVRCSHQSLTGHSPQQWSSRCHSRWRLRPEGLCTLPAPNQTAAASFFRRPSACYAVLAATPLTWLVRATSTSPSARRQAQSSRLRATL